MKRAQKFNLVHGALYIYGEHFQERNQDIPEELDNVEDIAIYCKEHQLPLYYWPEETILGYMEEFYVARVLDRYDIKINAANFFSYVEGKEVSPFPEKLVPPTSEESLAFYAMKLDDSNDFFCVGAKSVIERLRNYEKKDMITLANFLAVHYIYCGISCEDKTKLFEIPRTALSILYGSGLIVDEVLFVEAMILSDLQKSYQSLELLQMTKEELDDLVERSWWNEKFKIK